MIWRTNSLRKFFKKLETFFMERGVRCQELLPTSKFKINNDFWKHYQNRKNVIEEKSVNITNIGTVRKFEITFEEHSSIYNFYNSEALVDEFLLNVKNRIESSNTNLLYKVRFFIREYSSRGNWWWSTIKKFTALVYRGYSNKII